MPTDIHRSSEHTHSYCAYLVRLWKDGEPAVWRASVQSVQTGKVERFATLEDLFVFLTMETMGGETAAGAEQDRDDQDGVEQDGNEE